MKRPLQFPKIEKKYILYLVFGISTTVVNYLLYFLLFYLANLSAMWSNMIAWFFAVIFSFIVNKIFVFVCLDLTIKRIVKELVSFIGSRLFTGALETFILFIFVDVFDMSTVVWKLVVSIFTIVCNYITSSFVFHKN